MAPSLDLLSPELRLLYAVAGERVSDEEILDLLARDLDWGIVGWVAERSRAAPALWDRLRSLDGDHLPEGAKAVQQQAMVVEFLMLHLERRLDECLHILQNEGIETLLLKGAGLGKTLYGSFVERPMADVDLLVRPDVGVRAFRVLEDAGWREDEDVPFHDIYESQHHHLPPLRDPAGTGMAVEIHTRLFPGSHPFRLTAERVWERAEPVSGYEMVLVPSLGHQIVHLAIHFAWSHMMSGFTGWRTFRDLHHFYAADALDWEDVAASAEVALAATCCYWMLRLARSLTALDVPQAVLDQLAPPGGRRRLDMLERAFVLGLSPIGLESPSVRLARHAWSLGIRPGWSGHVGAKPWEMSDSFAPAQPTGTRLSHQLRQIPVWGRYLRAVLGTGT